MPCAIETYRLTKHFIRRKSLSNYLRPSGKGKIVAVQEVSFQIKNGELFGLLDLMERARRPSSNSSPLLSYRQQALPESTLRS